MKQRRATPVTFDMPAPGAGMTLLRAGDGRVAPGHDPR